jgi:DNA-binding XRE family transcriptional regulator
VLAKTVGVSHDDLSQIETGQLAGDIQIYARLARRLGVAIEDLICERD